MIMAIKKNDDLGFKDFFYLITKHKKLFIFLPLVFSISIVLLNLGFGHPNFKASANILIGKLNGNLIEEKVIISDKILSESFMIKVTRKLPVDLFKNKNTSDLSTLLKNTHVKTNDSLNKINISVLADSPTKALLEINAIIEVLKLDHLDLLEKYKNTTQAEIDITNSQINQLIGVIYLQQKDVNQNIILKNQIFSIFQLQDLFNRQFILRRSLDSSLTFNTQLYDDVNVSNKPEERNLLLIALSSYMFALFFTIFVTLIRKK